ncbi:MAG TPA: RidA family protein [Nitriliruptorales bacterium]
MASPEQRLAELGIELPEVPAPAAAYQPWKRSGTLVFTAGQVPSVDGAIATTGKLGADLDVAQGQQQARICAINLLAIARAANGGSLDGVSFVKLTVFVASAPDFTEQHLVANGASLLLSEVLGDDGVHARSAVGVPSLPTDCAVEVEAILELSAGDEPAAGR